MSPSWFIAGLMSTITIDYVLTHENLPKTGDRCFTQLAKMSIDLEFVEPTADVVRITIK